MVTCGAGYNAVTFFFLSKLGDLVVGSADLKRACCLEIFRFQVHVAIGIDAGCLDHVCFADNVLENVACVINFIKSKHISLRWK